MLGLLDHVFCGAQGVAEDEIGEIGVLERHGPQQQRLFLGTNAQGHLVIVFDSDPGHGAHLLSDTFKAYRD
jgi:hypothetical protein